MRSTPCFVGLFCLFVARLMAPSPAAADVFGSGASTFQIDFVAIGNPGNPPDANPNPAGAVPYSYRMGKYEISEQMIEKANAFGGLGITKDARGPDKPATSVTWFEAARFVNWLNTSTGHAPAYKFIGTTFQLWAPGDVGYSSANRYRHKFAKYVLPSIDEWHKAAYYDPVAGVYYDYPTGRDSVPDGIDFVGDSIFDAVFFDGGLNPGPNDVMNVGLLSLYGTAGQGGNAIEWEETAGDRINNMPLESRGFRGGDWGFGASLLNATNRNGIGPLSENVSFGFRVASIPEPSSLQLLAFGLVGILARRERRSRTKF